MDSRRAGPERLLPPGAVIQIGQTALTAIAALGQTLTYSTHENGDPKVAAVVAYLSNRLLSLLHGIHAAGSVTKLFIDIDDTPPYPLAQGIKSLGHATRDIVIWVRLQGRGKQTFQLIKEGDLGIDLQGAIQQISHNPVILGPEGWIVQDDLLVGRLR